MTDVLEQLDHLTWRGISLPITSRSFGFQHEQEKNRFLFRDEQLIESIGRENPTYRYTIPFREDIAKGPWVHLFTQVYPLFLTACLDRTDGDLGDPVHGLRQCKCVSLEETVDVNKRDGVDVDAVFVVSPDEDTIEDPSELAIDLSTIQGAVAAQGFFDKQAGTVDPATRELMNELNRGSEFAKVDPLTAATGVLNQVELIGNKFDATLADVAFKVQRADDALGRVANPKQHPVRRAARNLELAARTVRALPLPGLSGSKSRRVRVYQVQFDMGLMALAGKLHNTTAELIRLNPQIAKNSTVRTGQQVNYLQ